MAQTFGHKFGQVFGQVQRRCAAAQWPSARLENVKDGSQGILQKLKRTKIIALTSVTRSLLNSIFCTPSATTEIFFFPVLFFWVE